MQRCIMINAYFDAFLEQLKVPVINDFMCSEAGIELKNYIPKLLKMYYFGREILYESKLEKEID